MAIIGNGNIASVCKPFDREDRIIFASGVSDSGCTDEIEFLRERSLLSNQDKSKHLIYFSSLGIYYNNKRYFRHKKSMEALIKANFKTHTIVRLEVCEWVNNPTVIHNFFRKKIANEEPVIIQDAFRYVISLQEFHYWMSLIPLETTNEMNVPGVKRSIQEIYDLVKEGKL